MEKIKRGGRSIVRAISRVKNKSLILLVVVLVAALASSFYFYQKYQDSQYKLKHPEVAAKAQTRTLVQRVGKHIELPKGEPTIATVSDVSKLSSQTFFIKAKNGDKVLIYNRDKEAILYRPSEDRIINVAALNLSGQ